VDGVILPVFTSYVPVSTSDVETETATPAAVFASANVPALVWIRERSVPVSVYSL
jgi:hypothetical protein